MSLSGLSANLRGSHPSGEGPYKWQSFSAVPSWGQGLVFCLWFHLHLSRLRAQPQDSRFVLLMSLPHCRHRLRNSAFGRQDGILSVWADFFGLIPLAQKLSPFFGVVLLFAFQCQPKGTLEKIHPEISLHVRKGSGRCSFPNISRRPGASGAC